MVSRNTADFGVMGVAWLPSLESASRSPNESVDSLYSPVRVPLGIQDTHGLHAPFGPLCWWWGCLVPTNIKKCSAKCFASKSFCEQISLCCKIFRRINSSTESQKKSADTSHMWNPVLRWFPRCKDLHLLAPGAGGVGLRSN